MGYVKDKIENNIEPLVSVIIPTTNKELLSVERCVDSIKESTYRNVEIIVVNANAERSRQRNIGIDRAKGKYLFFPDSDWVITPDLIRECVQEMEEWPYVAVYIPEIIKTKGLFAKIRNWERQFYTATPIDVVRFIRAGDCPRFDESMSGPEDSDFDRRVGNWRTTTQNCYYHYDGVNFFSYFKKKAYYSKSMNRFAEKWPHDETLDFKYRCFGVFFEKGKWKRFLSNPFMALAVMVLIGIRGVIYLQEKNKEV